MLLAAASEAAKGGGFDWTPIAIILTFGASIGGSVLVYLKGRQDNKTIRDQATLDAEAKGKEAGTLAGQQMASLAFESVREDLKVCKDDCAALRRDNNQLHAENFQLKRQNARQEGELADLREEVDELRTTIDVMRGGTL